MQHASVVACLYIYIYIFLDSALDRLSVSIFVSISLFYPVSIECIHSICQVVCCFVILYIESDIDTIYTS